MLKAVIFDLDGLMVDSTPIQREASRLFLARYEKIYFSSSGREGMRMIDIIREYKDIYDLPGEVEQLYKMRQKIFFTLARDRLELFPEALPLLEKLEKRNLKLALATSGDRDYVRLLFEKFPKLIRLFSVVTTSEDVVRGKPYPDVYKITLEKLGTKPSDAVVLEDSVNGILSAKAAGIHVICIPNQNYPDADYSIADKVFPTLRVVDHAIS